VLLCSCVRIRRTANQLEAKLVDLVESIAVATDRDIKWVGGRIARVPKTRSGSFKTRSGSLFGNLPPLQRIATSSGLAAGSATKVDSVYIIHEPDAQPHAENLREGILQQTQVKQCYVGAADSPEDMKECLERVASSVYVILLQTRSVLIHEWPLLASYHAALAGVPFVCVTVVGGGYDFDSAEDHLTHLEKRLDAATLTRMSSVISEWTPPRAVASLQARLFSL
jgi:hypothetical protein